MLKIIILDTLNYILILKQLHSQSKGAFSRLFVKSESEKLVLVCLYAVWFSLISHIIKWSKKQIVEVLRWNQN